MNVFNLKSTVRIFEAVVLVAGAMLCVRSVEAQTTPTNIQISNGVLQTPVHRLGVNLGDQGYWDSGQMTKNLVFTNPGFEGLKYRVIFHCETVTGNTCQDDNGFNGQPTGYWQNASYLVITGNSYGVSGTLVNNTANPTSCGSCGPTLQFDKNVNMAVGDYVEVSKYFPGAGDAGWWDDTKGGGTITTETTDLSPETPGQQAIVLGANKSGAQAIVTQYFDSYTGRSFLQLNGSYEATFRAKSTGGNNQLTVELIRTGNGRGPYLNQKVTLTNSWQDFTLNFSASETGSAVGTVGLSFTAAGANVELDDVAVVQTNSSSSNPTAFRDDVVNALKQLNPGSIRMMAAGAALGSNIPNQLQVPFGRYRSGFNADQTTEANVAYGIHEFLQLCQTVGSDPWITIPTSTTPQEMTDFIEYLTGTGGDSWSSLRISRGQTSPWTSVFKKIHIELGNETWNGDFKGESMALTGYPQWANKLFAQARATTGYQASKFDLVLDGWSQVPWYNANLLAASTQHDSIDIAPYLLYSLNNESQSTMFGAMMAEPEMFESPGGIVNTTMGYAQAAPTPTNVNVYETNIGSMIGSPTQSQLNTIAPSVAAGVAMADHELQMMRLGVQYQNAFALPQFNFERADGLSVPLWGLVVDMGTTNRRRPQFLTEALANSVIGGNMLQTTQGGSNPTWNQPLSSDSVQLNGAHYLQSFAFLNGTAASAVIFNLNLTNSLPITFSGQNAPTGTVQMSQITSENMTDNNESSSVVATNTQTLSGFNPSNGLSLPPFSMTVLSWTSTVAQAPQFSVPAGIYSTTQTVSLTNTTAGAVTYYTTDGTYPTTSSKQYTGPLTITASTRVEAMTVAPSFSNSPVASAQYTIQPYAASPSFVIPAGTYSTTQHVGITATTPGAAIYYTTNGSTPTTSSTLYTGPVTVNSNLTMQAIVTASNYSPSPVASATYTIAPPTPTPYFTTPGGSFNSPQTIAILDALGGSIYYTTDGSTPTKNSNLYSSTQVISQSETLNAIAIAPGFSASAVASAVFNISTFAATPALSEPGSTYYGPQTLSLTDSTAGSVIHYTLDGSTPTASSAVYTGPLTINTTEYVSAAAIAPGYKLSRIGAGMFNMVAANPTANLSSGSYSGTQVITLSDSTPNTAIFYTTDGSTPTTQSTSYSGSFAITGSKTIRAMAGEKGYANSSVVTWTYTIGSGSSSGSSGSGGTSGQTPTPTLSPAGGTYSSAQSVTISDATAGASIYYTTDGSTPNTASNLYTGPVKVSASETLTAKAWSSGLTSSNPTSAAYVISSSSSSGSTSLVPFGSSFTASQIATNGSANVTGGALQLVSGGSGQGGTGWYPTKLSVSEFSTDFNFQLPTSAADGLTFTIQNDPAATTALGGNASGLGYQTVSHSVAVAFNFYESGVTGAQSVGVYTNGESPQSGAINLVGSGINLHNGDSFHVHIGYSGTAMQVVLKDNVTGVAVTENFTINIPSIVGANTAYVGFTGSTGGHTSVQNILQWVYSN